jgi:Flp pilus assembly protein TadB
MNPRTFADAFLSSTGLVILGACGVLYMIGFLWIRRIVKVEV